MSSLVIQHYTVNETVRAVLDPIPWMPVAFASLTMPFWMAFWQQTGTFFGALAQVLGAGLIGYKLWQAWRDRRDDAASERLPRTVEAGAKAAVTVCKLTKTGITVLALSAAVMGFLYWVAHKKRDAQPAAILSAATLPAPRRRKVTADDAGEDGEAQESSSESSAAWPKWYRLAYADLGTEEGPGKLNNKKVVAYYADAGHPEVKHDEVPWCAAFVCACLERAGVPSPKTLAAKDFDDWGVAVASDDRRIGDVVRLWRDSPRSWKGHVGFYAGETSTHVKLCAGNQGDRVSIAPFPKGRIVTVRRPRGLAKSHTAWSSGTAAVSGAGATGVTAAAVTGALDDEAPSTVEKVTQGVQGIAEPLAQSGHPKLMKIALLIVLGCTLVAALAGAYALYRRSQDFKARGY